MSSIGGCDGAISSVIAAQQSALQSKVSFAVAAKSLQAQEQQHQAAADLVQAAAELSKSVGKGERFDAQG